MFLRLATERGAAGVDRMIGARAVRSLGVAVALILLASCGRSVPRSVDQQEARWRRAGIHHYSFVYVSGGQCGPTRWTVTVRGRRRHVSPGAGCLAGTDAPSSVEAIFDEVRSSYHHADRVTVTYDSRYGFPARVSVDPDRQAIDDEHGFDITHFTVLK